MNPSESLLDPLDEFYLASGIPTPDARRIESPDIPEPYRSLLVHEDDMTPTLEAAHRQRIHLRLVERKLEGEMLLRRVVLLRDKDDQPVVFGAIRIRLAYLTPEARQLVLEGRLTLGRVLGDMFIQNLSRPVAYFEVRADSFIGEALQTEISRRLYGPPQQIVCALRRSSRRSRGDFAARGGILN